MKHQGTVRLETERLILRPFLKEDAVAAFHNWMSDEKVTEFLRWPTHQEMAVSERVVSEWIGEYEKRQVLLSVGNCAKGIK